MYPMARLVNTARPMDPPIAISPILHQGPQMTTALTWLGVLPPVSISIPHGFYDEPFAVNLTASDPEATIRYTVDGSEPDEKKGAVYNGPITVEKTMPLRAAAFKPGFRRSPVATQTYVFLDDVIRQPADPPGFPNLGHAHHRLWWISSRRSGMGRL